MYPVAPNSMVLDTTLAQTGAPVAGMLIVATVLLLVGLLLVRTGRYLALAGG